MRKLVLTVMIIGSFTCHGQDLVNFNWFNGDLSRTFSSRMDREIPFGSYAYTEEEKKAILLEQYSTQNYQAAKVDEFNSTAYLRYSLYNGQMEFVKEGEIFYLTKEAGRTVRFVETNTLYRVYEIFGNLEFLEVLTEGENTLLRKESMKFIPPTKKASSYGGIKKPKFKKNKDEFYLKRGDGQIERIPLKKKTFYKTFGEDESTVKNYVKKEKLNYKNLDDLKKLIEYLNK